jgi:hypothetical protein
MRKLFLYFFFAFFICLSSGDVAQTSVLTDNDIIGLTGSRFTKIFSLCGDPADLYTIRGNTSTDDAVMVDYPSFGFKVKDKLVVMSIFWKEYTGSVKGFHIGDSKAAVIDKLGDTNNTYTNSDETVSYYWTMNDYYFGVVFDQSDHITMFKVEAK